MSVVSFKISDSGHLVHPDGERRRLVFLGEGVKELLFKGQ